MSTFDHITSDIEYRTAIELQEHSLFALLNASIKRDGNQWCVLYGENIQDGICGFGDSPHRAVIAFNAAWYEKIPGNEITELFAGTNDALDKIKV